MKLILTFLLLLPLCAFGQVISGNARASGNAALGSAVAGGGAAAWTPASEPSLVLWLRSDYGVSNYVGEAAADADNVFMWVDKSGNGFHAICPSTDLGTEATPTNYVNGINETISVIGITNSVFMTNSYTIVTNFNGDDLPFTFAGVIKSSEGASDEGYLWEFRKPSGTVKYQNFQLDDTDYIYLRYDGTTSKTASGGTVVQNEWHSVILQVTGTAASIYVDGTNVVDAADVDVGAIETTSQQATIGKAGLGSAFGGYVAEIIFFKSSSVDVDSIAAYFKNRYGTP